MKSTSVSKVAVDALAEGEGEGENEVVGIIIKSVISRDMY